MIARCIRERSADLGGPFSPTALYTSKTVFHVTIGSDYVVMGMGIWGSTLIALVRDNTGKPNWLPAGLFDLGSKKFPSDWQFTLIDGLAASGAIDPSNRWVARWGYPELIRDPAHSDQLVERDSAALEVFYRELDRVTGREPKAEPG